MAKNSQPLLLTHNHDDSGSSSSGELRSGEIRVHKTAVNCSVTAVTDLTELARLLKPIGNRSLTVPTKQSFSANRSV
jgi:hypothetical protein